jgi:butyrate kinase
MSSFSHLSRFRSQLGLGSFSAVVVRHGNLGTVPGCSYTSLLVQVQEAKTLRIERMHAHQGSWIAKRVCRATGL